MLSDVFTEKTQFDWMHEVLWELIRSHPSEDELVMQYAVMGLCKSGAVVGLDTANGERLSKIVEVTLKVRRIFWARSWGGEEGGGIECVGGMEEEFTW